jgi:hypothetical protein
MTIPTADVLGWAATAVFVASYFFSRPSLLRGLQMVGAALWILYGIVIGALPVIAANALVFAAAAWTLARGRARAQREAARGAAP